MSVEVLRVRIDVLYYMDFFYLVVIMFNLSSIMCQMQWDKRIRVGDYLLSSHMSCGFIALN